MPWDENGTTPQQVPTITGDETLKEIGRYMKSARQQRFSQQAIALLTETDEEQEMANPAKRFAASPGTSLNRKEA